MSEEYIKREDALFAVTQPHNVTLRERIEAIPAADVAPVRHAKWVPNSINTHAKCSCCGEPATLVKDDENFQHCEWYSPYCPSCGSRMDLEVETDAAD